MSRYDNVQTALGWLLAARLQGQRIRDIKARCDILHGLPDELQPADLRLHLYRPAEEHFFLVATMKAADWLEEIRGECSSLDEAIDRFRRDLPYDAAKQLRDMREHDEEYVKGKGRLQTKAAKNSTPDPFIICEQFGTLELRGSIRTTVDFRDRVLIGGTFDLDQAIKAIEEMLGHVDSLRPKR